ncbi:MAG: hypothetical protein H7A21_12180 [Spirochaetales bacterium]|nr:hypothetical protein [Leptospiraceae bacterium]MCP5482185.1 hypothetical protein [Spirochaetales bacterium]MCP5484703.1 hypothetical protein [Spirochaetales bacterium]
MEEFEYDKTRKSIGAEGLRKTDRKEMLEKFKGVGGQVQKERAVKKPEPERERGRRAGGGGDLPGNRLPSDIAREKNRAMAERAAASRKLAEAEEKEATGFFARLSIKFRCAVSGLTPFGQDMVQPKFLSLLNLDAKRAIMECQILGNDLFLNNRKTGQAIVKELDQKNPMLVELLERAAALYNRQELSELVGAYSPSSRVSVPLDAIRAPIFSLLRKLYYLKPYQETYLVAAEQAIDIQQREEKKQAALYSQKKKKIRQEWKVLLNTIYPGLVLLAQRAEMKKAEPGSRLFEEMLGVIHEDKIGTREAGTPVGGKPPEEAKAEEPASTDEAGEEGEEEADEKETSPETEKSRELQYGYRLMKILPVQSLRQKHDVKGELKNLDDHDKVFLAYMFLKEFDEEYSFILTTPQIKLDTSYEAGVKQDYRLKMRDAFEESRVCHDAFRSYLHEAEEFHKVSQESGRASNYVEFAKRLSNLEGRRGAQGREARIQIKEYMEKLSAILLALIKDMRGANQIVLNREEPVKFQLERDARKRLNGKAVKDCIMQAYCYTIALADRLEGGDLYGGVIEMSDEEFEEAFRVEAG